MSDKKDAKKGKGTPEGKDGKDGKKKGKKGKQAPEGAISIAGHPRASGQVRRAKGFGGVAGFLIAALIGLQAGIPAAAVLERALIGGIGGYLIIWACAVSVWRHLMLAELRAFIEVGHSGEASGSGSAPVSVAESSD